ncbi:MAG: hypothetical protein ACTSQY_03280 [Candidatus Odinarchaeia archaeon]
MDLLKQKSATLKTKPIILVLVSLVVIYAAYATLHVENGNINISGNVTADNVHIPAYYRNGGNDTIAVLADSVWINITFQKKVAGLKVRFIQDHTTSSNYTHIALDSGIYEIHYNGMISDSAANPTAHVGMRMAYVNGTKIRGSYAEKDASKQNAEFPINHGFITEINGGDPFILQFTSDQTTVSLQTHATFEEAGSAAKISMTRID